MVDTTVPLLSCCKTLVDLNLMQNTATITEMTASSDNITAIKVPVTTWSVLVVVSIAGGDSYELVWGEVLDGKIMEDGEFQLQHGQCWW